MLSFTKIKVSSIYLILILTIFFASLNFKNNKLLDKKINLGLDLQGGSYILLEIDTKPLVNQKLQTKVIPIKKLLNKNEIKFKDFIISEDNISLICLAGYMRILEKNFLDRFKGKIINIHPSLLPKYKGLNTFKRILKTKEKITGCTVHYVNKKLDTGRKILQKKIFITPNDNEKTLKYRVQQVEHKAYAEAIIRIYN